MLIFLQKIIMDGHADFSPENQHGWPCLFFLKKLTWMAMLIFLQKSTWMAMLIFSQKINMDGVDFSPKNQHGWPC